MKNTNKYLKIFLMIIILFSLYRFVNYGSVVRDCNYTTQDIAVPSELSSGYLQTTQPTTKITNFNDTCLDGVFSEGSKIVETKYASNYKLNTGAEISDISVGTKFWIVGIKEVTKHGISTIDSGSGPTHNLILKDTEGKIYLLTTVGLGINDSDRFMSFIDKEGNSTILGPDNFIDYNNFSSFKFELDL